MAAEPEAAANPSPPSATPTASKLAGNGSNDDDASPPTQLIVVCCHGIWLGPSTAEEHWLIRDFQRGETETFIEHVKAGLRLLVEAGGRAALVFSGYVGFLVRPLSLHIELSF